MMRWLMMLSAVAVSLVSLAILGCGETNYSEVGMEADAPEMALTDSSGSMVVAETALPNARGDTAVERKIVYTADVFPSPTSAAGRAARAVASGQSACLWRIMKDSWPPPENWAKSEACARIATT